MQNSCNFILRKIILVKKFIEKIKKKKAIKYGNLNVEFHFDLATVSM